MVGSHHLAVIGAAKRSKADPECLTTEHTNGRGHHDLGAIFFEILSSVQVSFPDPYPVPVVRIEREPGEFNNRPARF